MENQMKPLPGTATPLGTAISDKGVNFAVFSESEGLSLLIFHTGATKPFLTFTLDPAVNKTERIWHVFIPDLDPPFEYGYKAIYKDTTFEVHDPYAKGLSSSTTWGSEEHYNPKGRCFIPSPFDWEGIEKPKTPFKDWVIYEMHVRGFTKDASCEVLEKGTFLGMIHKIPHLVSLGVNAVELLPIFEFNERESKKHTQMENFWGYSTVNFFCPMQRYAFGENPEDPSSELKTLVKELHRNGIAVILDVVYNHTAEGDNDGPVLSFKGLGRSSYYLIDSGGNYLNFTGTGNTVNANHPITKQLIVDSLSYFAEEMQIDGFRFDLASILTRGENGEVLADPPVLEEIDKAPALKDTVLIAEAWDAAGLYQVGSFPGKRWAEWNGRYRDIVRKFIKGTDGQVQDFMQALCGSDQLYRGNSPLKSVNFITAHDGFTLYDLVSYQKKHNEANKENNQDGANDNESWNCGTEGETSDKTINFLRMRQMKNFQTALFLSLGIPMILSGDEYAHTKNGNNNTYCQDNTLNYFLWDKLEEQRELLSFTKNLILFRKEKSDLFCRDSFLSEKDIEWLQIDFSPSSRFVGYILKDKQKGKHCLIAFNASESIRNFTIPNSSSWSRVVDTALSYPTDFITDPEKRPRLLDTYLMGPRSAIIAEAILT